MRIESGYDIESLLALPESEMLDRKKIPQE